jgi:hypothetical protein
LWEKEINAYKTLGGNAGIVKYLGEFSHEVDGQTMPGHPPKTQATYNILLEYAENDLDEYFYRSPPILTDHI